MDIEYISIIEQYINITCRLFYEKHKGNLSEIMADPLFCEFNTQTSMQLYDHYEVYEANIPLFNYYNYLTGDSGADEMREEFGEDATLETVLEIIANQCKNLYPTFMPD